MTPLRDLGVTLEDLCQAMLDPSVRLAGLRVWELALDIPVEVALAARGGGPVVTADVPRWRWRTDFDRLTSRLRVRIGEQPPVTP